MEVSKLIKLGVLSLCLSLLGGLSSNSAQEVPAIHQETILSFVHDLLQVFYPEAFTKDMQLNLCISHPADAPWREISGVYFRVTRGVPKDVYNLAASEQSANSHETPTVLGGWFWFRPKQNGRIQQMVTSSDVVHEAALEAFRASVQSHPEWSDSRAITALKEAGAQYGPENKERFVTSLPFAKSQALLGNVRTIRVEFQGIGADRTGNFTAGAFIWIVQGEIQYSDGTRSEYGFTLEPFGGKLIGITHISDCQPSSCH